MSKWPFPGDSTVVRARKIAWAYRALAEEMLKGHPDADPNAVADLDARFRSWGERWPAPVVSYDPDELVDPDEAADITGLAAGTISALRRRGRIKGHLRGGKQYLYLVRDLHRLSSEVRSRKDRRTVTVSVNGTGASTVPDGHRNTPQQPTADSEAG
jgi:hypothetical protein